MLIPGAQAVTYHTASMVTEIVAACVHHPKIRHTQTLDPLARRLFPGFAHITQNHIHHPFRGQVDLNICFGRMRRFLLLEVNVSLVQFLERIGRDGTSSLIFRGCEQLFPSGPTPVRIAEKGLEVGLYFWRQEITLYGRDALWWLGRYDVDTDDTAARFGQVNGYL